MARKTYPCPRLCGAEPFPSMTAVAVHVSRDCQAPNYSPVHCHRCASPIDPRKGPTCEVCGFVHPDIPEGGTG